MTLSEVKGTLYIIWWCNIIIWTLFLVLDIYPIYPDTDSNITFYMGALTAAITMRFGYHFFEWLDYRDRDKGRTD